MKADAIPRVPREPKLDKNEQAMREAQTAHEGSRWGELLEASVH